MTVDIRADRPRNEAALRAWWEVGKAATAERPGKPWPVWEVSRIALPTDNPERGITLIGAIDGDAMVGAGLLPARSRRTSTPRWPSPTSSPDRAREGIGRALVDELEARRRGRRADDPPVRGLRAAGVETAPAEAFAAALGYVGGQP